MNAHDLGDYSKSYLSQIGSIKPELLTILYKCPGRKKKEERRKKKEEEEEEEEEEEDLEFALIDRRVAPVKIASCFCSNQGNKNRGLSV